MPLLIWAIPDRNEYQEYFLGVNADCPGEYQSASVPGGWGSQISRQSAHIGGKIISPTHQPHLPPGYIPGTHFCQRLNRVQCHNAAGRIMSKKISSDNIGNRNSDLLACSAASQPLRAPLLYFLPLIFGITLFVSLHFITLTCTYSIISLGNIIFDCRPLFSETRQGRVGRAWSMVNPSRELS
jgi:hypothetical protein